MQFPFSSLYFEHWLYGWICSPRSIVIEWCIFNGMENWFCASRLAMMQFTIIIRTDANEIDEKIGPAKITRQIKASETLLQSSLWIARKEKKTTFGLCARARAWNESPKSVRTANVLNIFGIISLIPLTFTDVLIHSFTPASHSIHSATVACTESAPRINAHLIYFVDHKICIS